MTADQQLSDYKSGDSSLETVEHIFQETDPTKDDLPKSRSRKRPNHLDSETDVESCGEGMLFHLPGMIHLFSSLTCLIRGGVGG